MKREDYDRRQPLGDRESEVLKKITSRASLDPEKVINDVEYTEYHGRGRFTLCIIYDRNNHRFFGMAMHLPDDPLPHNVAIGRVNAFVKAVRDLLKTYKNEEVTIRFKR